MTLDRTSAPIPGEAPPHTTPPLDQAMYDVKHGGRNGVSHYRR